MSNERILVVDDNREFLKFFAQDVLPQYGYETLIAMSGHDALRKMMQDEPAIVLLDVQMPDISGLDVLREMRGQQIDVPVIMMTAHGSESIAVSAFQLGAKDYLMKPFDLDLARVAIDRQLEQVRLRREKERLTRQLEQTQRDLERRVKELTVLFGISKSVTSLLELDKVLERVVEAAVFIANAEEGALWLVEDSGRAMPGEAASLTLHAGKNLAKQEAALLHLPVQGTLVGQAMVSRQPVRISRAEGEGEFKIGTGYRVCSLLAVPLSSRGRDTGVLSVVQRTRARGFTASDETMLQTLADYAAIAIENARAYQATDQALAQRVDELTNLYEISRMVASTLDREEIFDLVTAKLAEMFQVEAGALLLVDEETEELEFVTSWLGDREPLRGMRMKMGQGVVGQVAVSCQPALVNDAYHDERFYSEVDRTTGFVTRSILCAPLTVQDRCIGVIELLNKIDEPFVQEDVERLTNVARSLAIALDNARLYEEARQLHEAKSRFVATMARELRLPLTAIKGYSEMLASEMAGSRSSLGMESAGQIRINADRLITLMEDLLDISRLETGEANLQLEPVAIKEVIAQITSAFEQRLKEKNLRLNVKVPARLPLVYIDRERVGQVLGSLLTNAYYYTLPKGRITVEAQALEVAWRQRDVDWAMVSVADTGIGIGPDEQSRVFERFFRGDHPVIRQHPGRGLSLSISKSLVELHGGRMWVESEPGRGSIFHFTLPLVGNG
ncbi:MAG: GAF domain-containing protein [Anaerolineae bacterium]|nr:GAF domain-containing protein [Anaerolineae bacterium]